MTSEDNDVIKKSRKSPSQLMRDKYRKQKYIDSKSPAHAPPTTLKVDKPDSKKGEQSKTEVEKDTVNGSKKAMKETNANTELSTF